LPIGEWEENITKGQEHARDEIMADRDGKNCSTDVIASGADSGESRQKYEFLLELCNDGILIVQDGKIKESNHLMAKMCGYLVEEVLDTEFVSFFQEKDIKRIESICSGVVDDANAIEIHDITLMCKNGLKLEAEITAGQFVYNQRCAILLIVRDISDRIQAEAELQKNKKLDAIAAISGGIAHDYDRLLTAIIRNISQARLNLSPGHKAFMLVSRALEASETAKHLTQKLITFSKDSAPEKSIASAARLVKSATEFTLNGSNVKPAYCFAEDLDLIDADKIQIGQAIHNIVMNAKEAMPEGGIIKVRAENKLYKRKTRSLTAGRYVKISFQDHGEGIPEKLIDAIFNPYFPTKRRKAQSGPGLGLSICQSIVKSHDGELTVESKIGKGTTFHVLLPVASSPMDDRNSPERQETEISIFNDCQFADQPVLSPLH
jgi:PAS domain S-box-containing protein